MNARWQDVFSYFFRLGLFGFGGPLALVASMQKDLVEQRRWVETDRFAKAFALIKAMPGPLAFMCAVFLGRSRAGWKGGLAAAIALNLPAFVLMILFGLFYQSWRSLAGVEFFLLGMQASALGVVLASLRGLSRPYLKKLSFWIILLLTAGLTFVLPAWEPLFIVGFGACVAVIQTQIRWSKINLSVMPLSWPELWRGPANTAALVGAGFLSSSIDLLWVGFKAGAFVFGSGLAIVPLLEHDFVTRLKWLTHQEFMDALAFGQITPGPVVITITFIGFKALGLWGAVLGTLAIFAAPFFHMMTWFPNVIDRLSRQSWIQSFIFGAIAAVVGAIAATVLRLALPWQSEIVSGPVAIGILALTATAAVLSKIPAWTLIPIGGIASYVISLFTR